MTKALFRSLIGPAAFGAILFAAAGTVHWPRAWLFLILFAACQIATNVWLLKSDPTLMRARIASPIVGSQRWQDRSIAGAILLALPIWLAFIALDAARFGWSHVPVGGDVLGGALFVLGFWGRFAVLRANTFASVAVRTHSDRRQTVVRSGPYAVVRHPMYASMILSLAGTPLLLGSAWGLLGLAVLIPLLAIRALGEEAVLKEGLAGYGDYGRTVRFRFLPRVW